MHGPCSPSANDTRPLATDAVSPVTAYTDAGRLDASSAQSGRSIPTNTPPSPPSSVDRRAPDACSAAYAVSSSSRCCGSIAPDSTADTPNAEWSNRSASRTKPPCDTHAACTSLRVPTSTTADSVHRAVGTAPTASPLACSIDHSAPAPPSHPPGQHPAAPRTHARPPPAAARAELAASTGTSPACAPTSCSSTCAAIARGVGCSNTSVGESASPVATRSRLDSSVAASESIPASISGVLAVTLASASPVSSRTARSTSDSRCGCRCDAGSAASVSASSRDAGLASTAAAEPRCCTLTASSPRSASAPTLGCIATPSCAGKSGNGARTAPQPCSTRPRHAAYCSSPSDHTPSIRSEFIVACPMPAPPTSGSCRLLAARPLPPRHRASASRHALAAACAAPPALGWNGDATCDAESRCNSWSDSTPAACSTPVGRTSAANAVASAASPPSHATTVVAPPDRTTARSDASRPCPPRATKPLRDVSTSRTAPRDASNAAPRRPRPPSPPVTSHAPAATPLDAAASGPRRRSRAPWRRPRAHATSDSAPPLPPDDAASDSSARTAAAALLSRGTSALSTRATGCSRRSTRAKPQLPPCAAPDSAPAPAPSRTATAPLVSSSSGGGGIVRHSSCARRTADCMPRTHGATPSVVSSSSATPRHARHPTTLHSGSLTGCTRAERATRIASAATPNAPAGCTASHWPPGDEAAGAASSAQPTLYRAMTEPSSAVFAAMVQG
eukprot:scaffold11254_cov67-Phaeocystis_antarctica.AAC.2